MKTYFLFGLFMVISVSFTSCKKDAEQPKVTYDTLIKPEKKSDNEANKIMVADLPIQMEGTSVLLFPIGEYSVSNGNAKYRDTNKDSYMVSNASEYEITGYLSNIKFQNAATDSLTTLSDKPILIERVTYLKSFADKTKKQFLVYVLEDMDSNKDGKLDSNDIRDLYISSIDGSNFIKLSKQFQELIDWNLIESNNRLYFRTIEDSNKNGAFDGNDTIHYNYVDLLSTDLKVIEYNPL
jgi:hypothetical protein